MATPYWSERQGRGPLAAPRLTDLRRLVGSLYEVLGTLDYFQEWFGFYCVDVDFVAGRAGHLVAAYVEMELGRVSWPVSPESVDTADEDELFDLLEFAHRHVSAGTDGRLHTYNNCGWHYTDFDPAPAQEFVRARANRLLGNYGEGFELGEDGTILRVSPPGLAALVGRDLPTDDPSIAGRVDDAVRKFRSRSSGQSDRRDAVRDLFDVLERLRPQVREDLMTQDEKDLFNIANKFAVRHHDAAQRGDYDGELWYSWMFYVNLATIHLLVRKALRGSGAGGG